MLTVSKELYEYWLKLKGERPAPERNEVEPGAIRGILADTFILDIDRADGFQFRISGSRANALFLRELRGSSFLQIWRFSDRQAVRAVLQRAADHARPHALQGEARPPGLAEVAIEIVLLPLRHRGSTCSRMLGAVAVNMTPHWLGLVAAAEIALVSGSPIDPHSPRESSKLSGRLNSSRSLRGARQALRRCGRSEKTPALRETG